ncbi:hypothetical protein ACE1BS_08965 [Aeromonas jandaei]
MQQLVFAGVVQELNHGRGSATYWQCCCHG